jgi:flagellar biosynthesis anti-sigma factor FlgM
LYDIVYVLRPQRAGSCLVLSKEDDKDIGCWGFGLWWEWLDKIVRRCIIKIGEDKQPQLVHSLPVSSAKSKTTTSQTVPLGSAGTTDEVELSSWKDEVTRLKEKAKAIPVVDEEKVARVKQAIESETYDVNNQSVARGILKSQLSDEIS